MASPAVNGQARRPSVAARHPTAPTVMTMNDHFASVDSAATAEAYKHGVQVISGDKEFNPNLLTYLSLEKVTPSGFNYHLISVFGSQSTGKSTLLNHLFGTQFGVMSEQERRQTTKGIWLSKNKKEHADGGAKAMAENILVMDVEGTDGRERGEDQDFERKSALFALATSEVLIVNIWEHQVGLYQGANMGLLKTVFEVNLQLFLKDQKSVPRSLLFFVIRDHLGTTPLINLQKTLIDDLSRIWASISKPQGLEQSRIEDYFDFAFAALPHKILQPEKFIQEVAKLGTRFREGFKNEKLAGLQDASEQGVFLPEYHRRIPADGFSLYASNVWEQIDSNKDLDLPTQQELLAQFRCDEIAREVLIVFDTIMTPIENRQADAVKSGRLVIIAELGDAMRQSRSSVLADFKTEASRYHKGVYQRKLEELSGVVDGRLRTLFQGQLSAAHKTGIKEFSESVSEEVRLAQKKGANYDFAELVSRQKQKVLASYEQEAQTLIVEGAPWSNYAQELSLFTIELDDASAQLRKDEMRRLANRVERWVKSHLNEKVGLEFGSLGSVKSADAEKPSSEKELWDRIWQDFTQTVSTAETRFTDRAKGFDASNEEVEVGLWRLRRKAWSALRAQIESEVAENNVIPRLRENFEDKFRYDSDGVPRIWRPTDDIESVYTTARHATLTLIPILSKFRLPSTSSPPPLDSFIGRAPPTVTAADEEDLQPIGGVDEDSGATLESETTFIPEARAAEIAARFKKTADGVYVEAKRSAIGGITQVPLYFYGLLLALGWNELVAVLRNPLYFILLTLLGVASYFIWKMNLAGPILRMADAASRQGLEVAKERLRDFLEENEKGARKGTHVRSSANEGVELKNVKRDDDDEL